MLDLRVTVTVLKRNKFISNLLYLMNDYFSGSKVK